MLLFWHVDFSQSYSFYCVRRTLWLFKSLRREQGGSTANCGRYFARVFAYNGFLDDFSRDDDEEQLDFTAVDGDVTLVGAFRGYIREDGPNNSSINATILGESRVRYVFDTQEVSAEAPFVRLTENPALGIPAAGELLGSYRLPPFKVTLDAQGAYDEMTTQAIISINEGTFSALDEVTVDVTTRGVIGDVTDSPTPIGTIRVDTGQTIIVPETDGRNTIRIDASFTGRGLE